MAILKKGNKLYKKTMPCIPLRDLIIFPDMVVPLLVGRQRSLNAIEESLSRDSGIVISFQKTSHEEIPKISSLYHIGVLAKILQSVKEPDGSMRILVEGIERIRIKELVSGKKFFCCTPEKVQSNYVPDKQVEALSRFVIELLDEYLKLNPAIPHELYGTIATIENPSRLSDTIAGYLPLKFKDKARVLETIPVQERLSTLVSILNAELEVLRVQRDIQSKVVKRIEENQKQYLLHEQLKTIQKELGKEDDSTEIAQLRNRIKKARLPKAAEKKAVSEISRLSKMMPISPEATVTRTYIEWLADLPWNNITEDNLNIKHAEKVLDEDHYGLNKPKQRVLEYLAVRKRTNSLRGPILCFVGPPGVGKTSLAKSVARALGRKFVRISLGGVRDEAEIRGHRRTYIGALPGRIIQSMKKAEVSNPVFLLDEIDKIGQDFRGDPSSALLEILDPEQNNSFSDHYLEVGFDLSKTLFITTANTEYTILPPLLDRMEIIPLPGYTLWDKLEIAKKFLIPRQMKEHGLSYSNLKISDESVLRIIRDYTREAGVRNLEREIGNISRKVTKKIVENGKEGPYQITSKNLTKYLGLEKFSSTIIDKNNKVGVATGMAWTEYGGDIIFIEVLTMSGKGNLILTGQLGEVMKESAQAALSYVRANAKNLKVKPDFQKNIDIHIHVPEGGIPKDGPSAGVTIATALVSCITNRKVDVTLAMTGEITLQGKVLKIGGLKSKILAAHRSGIKKIIIPKDNKNDLEEIPKKIKESLTILTVENIKEVLDYALLN